MKELPAVSVRPVQALDPIDQDAMDALPDKLLPAQEDQLPQGVLDLLASLVWSDRSMARVTGAPVAQMTIHVDEPEAVKQDVARPTAQVTVKVEPNGARPIDRGTVPAAPISPAIGKVIQSPLSHPLEVVITQEQTATQPSAVVVETMLPEPSNEPPVPPVSVLDQALPHAPVSLQGTRPVWPMAPASRASPVLPPPDVTLEIPPGPDRGLLQIPFNKGSVSGQVTISRTVEEPIRNLTLSPSNALVFEQLKEPFAQIREPAWRLAERDGEQPRQGAHPSPDEEQDELFSWAD